MTEFDFIKNYFATQSLTRKDVLQSIGDDAAIVTVPQQQQLVITTDTLVAGVHFPLQTSPYDIGYKSLAVNLSDLAAMGATPAWISLAITMPSGNEEWLREFCAGFFTLANRYQAQLIGGDTTEGPLSITIQAMGFIPAGKALLRRGAKPSELIYVTGTLGDAGYGLQLLQKKQSIDKAAQEYFLSRLNRPEPRIEIGQQLIHLATAAIDISDGLAADLNHLLTASRVGAEMNVNQLPLSSELLQAISFDEALALALTSGDDYELCFTVPMQARLAVEKILADLPCRYTCIGKITEKLGLDMRYQDGKKYHGRSIGYQHFREKS